MAVLRSASDQSRLQVPRDSCCCGISFGVSGLVVSSSDVDCAECKNKNMHEPSVEALMTLLWATYTIDREQHRIREKELSEQENEGSGDLVLVDAPSRSFNKSEDLEGRKISNLRKWEEKSASCRRSWASSTLGGKRRMGERWEK